MSDLNFEPAFILEFVPARLDPYFSHFSPELFLVEDVLRGVLVRHPWVAPNDRRDDTFTLTRDMDGKSPSSILRVRCKNDRSVISEKQLDAYLRYAQQIASTVLERLSHYGLYTVQVELRLYAFVESFNAKKAEK